MAIEYESYRDRARATREAARQRLNQELPTPNSTLRFARSSPCDGWFAAADLCYQQATHAGDINTAIEWYIQGDDYALAGEACMETLHTL